MLEHEGQGWRLAKDPSRKPFSVLIGGENWAFELTEAEGFSLASLVSELMGQHHALINHLMDEESICLEKENGSWWGCLEGDKNSWSLQVIFSGVGNTSRGVEFGWPSPSAEAVAKAMRTMWDSCY